MNYEKQKNGTVVFYDGDEKYTFVDMGNYIGHQNREWYENGKSNWMLMFYDNQKDDHSKITIESGNFMRFISLYGNTVDEDIIIECEEDDLDLPKETYIAFEDKYKEKAHPSLEEYLAETPMFVSSTGEVYKGNLESNKHIIDFLASNKSLSKEINNDIGSRQI